MCVQCKKAQGNKCQLFQCPQLRKCENLHLKLVIIEESICMRRAPGQDSVSPPIVTGTEMITEIMWLFLRKITRFFARLTQTLHIWSFRANRGHGARVQGPEAAEDVTKDILI